MSAESVVGGALILKWVGGIVIAIYSGLFGWAFKKINNTYTKLETEHLIDLKNQPLKESLDRNTAALDKLNDTMTEVVVSTKVTEATLEKK